MLQLLLMFAAAMPSAPGAASAAQMDTRERVQAATPVTDLYLLPPKVPDCRTPEEIQKSLAEKANGVVPQSCDPPKAYRR